MKATTDFDVTMGIPISTDMPGEGPDLSRIEITKSFHGGELTGESTGEGLFCGMSDPKDGAGYVVSERFKGQLGDRAGTFVLHHGGLMGPEIVPRTFGDIVPGSGTGQLEGISGTMEIIRTDDGKHQLILDYQLPGEE